MDNTNTYTWIYAKEKSPEKSGEYIIKLNNGTVKPALYLKAGDNINLKAYTTDNKPENIILFSLNKPVIRAEIPMDGFYLYVKNKKSGESLKYLKNKEIYWANTHEKTLDYDERSVISKKAKDISNKANDKIDIILKRDPRVKEIYGRLHKTFKNDVFNFCGTSYVVNRNVVDHCFMKALKYREIVMALKDYPGINTLSRMAFLPEAGDEYPPIESLKIREEMCSYLRALGEQEKDIETVSDAYFINLFLPTKTDVIKVLFQDEIKTTNLSKEMRVVRVFQKYQIIDAIRQLGLLYSPDNKGPSSRDGVIDTIATIQLSQALAINHFKIKEFNDSFNIEMGV